MKKQNNSFYDSLEKKSEDSSEDNLELDELHQPKRKMRNKNGLKKII